MTSKTTKKKNTKKKGNIKMNKKSIMEQGFYKDGGTTFITAATDAETYFRILNDTIEAWDEKLKGKRIEKFKLIIDEVSEDAPKYTELLKKDFSRDFNKKNGGFYLGTREAIIHEARTAISEIIETSDIDASEYEYKASVKRFRILVLAFSQAKGYQKGVFESENYNFFGEVIKNALTPNDYTFILNIYEEEPNQENKKEARSFYIGSSGFGIQEKKGTTK